MAISSESVRAPASSPKFLTIADVEALPKSLPSGPVCYELLRGKLIIMTPPGDQHGGIQIKIGVPLFLQGESRGLGKVRGEVGVVLGRNPDTVVGADAAFIANASLPIRLSSEGYLETIPELVVEVRSKNDTGPEVMKKVRLYLDAGVRVVWVVDPVARTVTAHRKRRKPQIFAEGDTLVVEDVIPGFQFPVAEVFRD
jgi:Uma2 family endonuclease